MVSTLATRISRLKAIGPACEDAFENCALTESSNNISGRPRRFGAAWRHLEDDHMKLATGIKGISVPTSSDAVILN